jgi:hypothetical protein
VKKMAVAVVVERLDRAIRRRELVHPLTGVACPYCQARPGSWCVRPSGHRAMRLHLARLIAADYIVPCPHCGAAAGQPCVGRNNYHAERCDRVMAELRRRLGGRCGTNTHATRRG